MTASPDKTTPVRDSTAEWWARVRAPIGAGDGTVPPHNSTVIEWDDQGGERVEVVYGEWRWTDWDGESVGIDEHGNVRVETTCFVDLSAAQWREIATVAAHVAAAVEVRKRAAEQEDETPDDPQVS